MLLKTRDMFVAAMNFTEPFIIPKRKIRVLTILQYIVLLSAILYFGRPIFVPLAFAVLISFVLYPVCRWMENKGIGRATAIAISFGILTLVFLVILVLLIKQLTDFAREWSSLQPRIEASALAIKEFLVQSVGLSPEQQSRWLSGVMDKSAATLMGLVSRTVSYSATSVVWAILIPVYVILILYYRTLWKEVLLRLFPDQNHYTINQTLSLTIDTYYNFIKGMGIVYLVVGILNSIGLLALGIPHAFLFGAIASVLTFIPYVGILVGALLPVTIAWATHDSIWYPLGVVSVFTFVQYLEANVIFPFAVSSRLKVNTLAVLLAIFVGGLLWGIAGMILFVPFVGIAKLISDQHPGMATISVALGTGSAGKEPPQ